MRTSLLFLLFTLFVKIVFGQEDHSVSGSPVSSGHPDKISTDSKSFHFVVMPDHTGSHRDGILQKGLERINHMRPDFVVGVGDMIEGYTEDSTEVVKEWVNFQSFVNQFKMPFFYVPGNHDYSNKVMADCWTRRVGSDYYSFVYKNVLFLCLNTEDGLTSFAKADIGEKQFAFVEKTLSEHPEVTWTMVFMHQPLWLNPAAKNWLRIEKSLSLRKHSVFAGHTHQYALHNRNNSDYFVMSTMGGVNTLRGKKYGEFDHFLWVTMTPDGPDYANLMLDGVEDKSVQTAENLARIESFKSNPPVRIEPYFFTGKSERSYAYHVLLNNPTKENYSIEVSFDSGKGLKSGLKNYTKSLSAGSKEEFLLPVQISEQVRWTPVIADVTLKADQYEWNTKVHLQPYKKLLIADTSKPIITDGDLTDWGQLRFSKKDTVSKAYFSFDVRKSTDFLHLAIDVTDNDIQAESNYANINQDAAIVLFDARNISLSSFNQKQADGVFKGDWLYLIASPTADQFDLAFKDKLPAGIIGKGRKKQNGYTIEFAIPLSILKKFQGEDWQNIRLNFSVIDKNKGDRGEPVRLNWMTDWTENYPGSGMFFRK